MQLCHVNTRAAKIQGVSISLSLLCVAVSARKRTSTETVDRSIDWRLRAFRGLVYKAGYFLSQVTVDMLDGDTQISSKRVVQFLPVLCGSCSGTCRVRFRPGAEQDKTFANLILSYFPIVFPELFLAGSLSCSRTHATSTGALYGVRLIKSAS